MSTTINRYIAQGWKLTTLAPLSKRPIGKHWNHPGQQLPAAEFLPPRHGVGICHAYSGTACIDIDNWDHAANLLKVHNIDLAQHYNAPDAVRIQSGRLNRGKLIYRMPEGKVMVSKKLIHKDDSGNEFNFLDFRCATRDGYSVQDVLPPSIHPDTKVPYHWEGDWQQLPMIPEALLAFWEGLVSRDEHRSIPSDTALNTSWDEICEALKHIPPDINRDDWVTVGMALHWAGQQSNQSEEAFTLWDNWSQGTPEKPAYKYKGFRDMSSVWRSFKSKGRTIRSLFSIARKKGWSPPALDPERLFKEVNPSGEDPSNYLDFMQPPAPQPDLTLWPSNLRRRAEALADSVGCDPLVPLSAGLAVASGAIDARIRLRLLPGFEVPPVIWLMVIGRPADKKSPGSRPMKEILRHIEKEDRPGYEQAMLEWEVEEFRHKEARAQYIEYHAGETHYEQGVEVPTLKPMPVRKKLIVQDITSQKLIHRTKDRPMGVLCWLDEMHAWIRKITDKRGTEDRSSWVAGYESEPYEMERVGAGDIYCENLAVSIYGNVQPKVLHDALGPLTIDGLMQRFIPITLRTAHTSLGEPIPAVFSEHSIWDQTIRDVHQLVPRTYTLSKGAYEHFRKFQGWHLKRLKEDSTIATHEDYQTALGKLVGQIGRLTLICHAIEAPHEQEVSQDLMARMIQIGKDFIVPSIRYVYSHLNSQDHFEYWLMNHILAYATRKTIKRSEIRRSAVRQFEGLPLWQKNQKIEDAMETLTSMNWVIKINDSFHQTEWAINPNLSSYFNSQRREVLRIRQSRLDENRRIAMKSGKFVKRRFYPGYREEFGEEETA